MKRAANSRRKFLIGLGAMTATGLFFGYRTLKPNAKESYGVDARTTSAPLTIAHARMGINLSGIAYWASELPFADLMHQSSEWISQPPSFGDWGTGPALDLDENGWVKRLQSGCRATKILCAGGDVKYPSGTYVILYDGEGEIELDQSVGNVRKAENGRIEVNVDSSKGMFAIHMTATNTSNHMRNIRVILPGLEQSYESNPWRPGFLERWQGAACIRVMDMMSTNNSSQVQWQGRPQLSDSTYAEKGVPVELLIDLTNRLQADIWLCMPHQATDDYVRQFAMVVKNHLQPGLRAWVEYSNEVWNGGFKQYDYVEKQGLKLKLSDDGWQAAFLFNGKRSVEIFKIWEGIFGGQERLVRVIASQAANDWHADQLLKIPEVVAHADVLAIAPYVTLNVPLKGDESGLNSETVAQWDLDKLFAYIKTVALPQAKQWMQKNKHIADVHGIKLVAYEAGQHLVGVAGAENDDDLTKLFMYANQDTRMGGVYTRYLNEWEAVSGDLICLFNSMSKWSKYGSWGLLQDYDQPASSSPKFSAVMDWAQSQGQKVNY